MLASALALAYYRQPLRKSKELSDWTSVDMYFNKSQLERAWLGDPGSLGRQREH